MEQTEKIFFIQKLSSEINNCQAKIKKLKNLLNAQKSSLISACKMCPTRKVQVSSMNQSIQKTLDKKKKMTDYIVNKRANIVSVKNKTQLLY